MIPRFLEKGFEDASLNDDKDLIEVVCGPLRMVIANGQLLVFLELELRSFESLVGVKVMEEGVVDEMVKGGWPF